MRRNEFIHLSVLAQTAFDANIPTSLLVYAAVQQADALAEVAPFDPENFSEAPNAD
jgi:hypothetical protein